MDYKIVTCDALVPEIDNLCAYGTKLLNPDRVVGHQYPGVPFKDAEIAPALLAEVIKASVAFDDVFHTSLMRRHKEASGVQFMHLQRLDHLDAFVPTPLIELDEEHKVLPQYDNQEVLLFGILQLDDRENFTGGLLRLHPQDGVPEELPLARGQLFLLRPGNAQVEVTAMTSGVQRQLWFIISG